MEGRLLFSAVTVRLMSGILFFAGLCQFMIHFQQMSVQDYMIGDPVPLVYSLFSLASAWNGMFLTHKEYVPRATVVASVTVFSSVFGSRTAHSKWLELKKLKSCSTYAPNMKMDPCLDYFDDPGMLNSIVVIPDRYRTTDDPKLIRDPDPTLSPSPSPTSGPVASFLGYQAANTFEVPMGQVIDRAHHKDNSSWYTNEFSDDISCYGEDYGYYMAAYYCTFWTLAQHTEKEDYCYCVTESASDGTATCHEYHRFPYCGDLMKISQEMELAMYVLTIITGCAAVVLMIALWLCYYFLWWQNTTLNVFKLYEAFVWSEPHMKKAVAHLANEGVVLSSVVRPETVQPRSSFGFLIRKSKILPLSEPQQQQPLPPQPQRRQSGDIVRDFNEPDDDNDVGDDDVEEQRHPPSGHRSPADDDDLRSPSPPLTTLVVSPVRSSIFKGYFKVHPDTAVTASPVTPRRRMFQERPPPIQADDAELDVANVVPYPNAVPFEGEELPVDENARPMFYFF